MSGEPTPDERSPKFMEALDSTHRNGNNGWAKGYGADRTTNELRALPAGGELDVELVVGAMLAPGAPREGDRAVGRPCHQGHGPLSLIVIGGGRWRREGSTGRECVLPYGFLLRRGRTQLPTG